ncbi:MAG: DUF2523 domain-containing protein [Aliivibrio sp.]|uniref:DUF2523 domain-containing protein n=1 Tax=Aliivibrio sp. TaxID=1872443 RepID=UPI001A404CCD|nr:DUF2523 domain-containing protein [Aliivibrio sp.]
MVEFYDSIYDIAATVLNYFENLGGFFTDFVVYMHVWYVKVQLRLKVMFFHSSYLVAVTLLKEIGFNTLFTELYNMLPSELRYWAGLFKLKEGFTLYINCAATALVLRLSR